MGAFQKYQSDIRRTLDLVNALLTAEKSTVEATS